MAVSGFTHVTFISAGAGSGKTHRLTTELERALVEEGLPPAGIIATTFTVKAAGELRDRVRERLVRAGRIRLSEQTSEALIGTVHSVCERLLGRFAFELGLSPEQNVLGLEDFRLFHEALDAVLDREPDRVRHMNAIARRLGVAAWQRDVKTVADRARDNDLTAADLPAMARASVDSLLAFFPEAVQGCDFEAALLRAIDAARAGIDRLVDSTQKTADYLDRLQSARLRLMRGDCEWRHWFGLASAAAARRSEPLAADVRAAAAVYETHPRLHGDICDYVEGVYRIAGATLDRFQDLKRSRGLIDFTDMEQLALHALDHPTVAATLEDELELLLVDEFQDTNPMQLALFVKLARFAKKVVFVGDVKQAIYAFRGCDPDLVFSTLDSLAGAHARTAKLDRSYRSRKPLVEWVNDVFTNAFAEDGIAADNIALSAVRGDPTSEPAVVRWQLAGKGDERFAAVARGVIALVGGGTLVDDPEGGGPRAVRFGDIAVLARTNDHVEAIALALKSARVPMKMSIKGLLATPEVIFAQACLRRLNDATDSLATAEVVAMTHAGAPEAWLAERLQFVAAGARDEDWLRGDHAVVGRLAELERESALQSPVEIVARVLNDIGIREVAAGWGPDTIKTAQRQRNLDAFLDLAVEYEKYCTSQHEAATLTGFLFWCEDPHSPDLDLQPTVTTGDAVHVLTYHKAKGLEWPVVVATDFDWTDRVPLWDVRVNLTAAFDVSAPLANRTVRYWPKVFGERTRGIPILDAIVASQEALECRRRAESEARRLAYVGITRARDLLVMALPEKPAQSAWLRTFAHERCLPRGDSVTLANGTVVATRVAVPRDVAGLPAPPPYAPTWFLPRPRLAQPVREHLNPSREPPDADVRVAEVLEIGDRIPIHADDMTVLGLALHAAIAAELVNPDRPSAIERTAAILRASRAHAWVSAEAALASARRFREFVLARFAPRRVLVEYPVSQALPDGRAVRGIVDVLLDTEAGWVLIDHKSSPRPRNEAASEAKAHSGQIENYRRALVAAGIPVEQTFIHFPVTGMLVRLERASPTT